jgi:ankyrin repeat protein
MFFCNYFKKSLIIGIFIAMGFVYGVDYNQQLLEGAKAGTMQHVEEALQKGANINAQEFTSYKVIIKVYHEHGGPAGWQGAEVDTPVEKKDFVGKTALMYAVYQKNLPMAKMLLAKGANPNIVNQADKKNALYYAVEQGNVEMVKLLLENKAILN